MRLIMTLAALLALSGCADESCRDRPCTPDEKLAEAVKASLDEHPALRGDALHVYAQDGVVYVHGIVATNLEYQMVDQYGAAVPGVRRFVNFTATSNGRY